MDNIGKQYFDDILELLAVMVRIPSFSREEGPAADIVEKWLKSHGKAVNCWTVDKVERP